MGHQINRAVLDRIRENTDIVEVISNYITLKKAGRNFKALCPFHSEKTPSFTVTPEKGIFHCFGCGAGGDVISFVMKMEKTEFPEAVVILAKKAGIDLELRSGDDRGNEVRAKILQLNYKAAVFFHECLLREKEAEPARAYLRKRNINPETIQKFLLGFAPASFQTENFLRKEGFSRTDLENAGLKFYQRVTFPIFNLSGECVGFGARSINGANPKYLNSAENPAFSKGNILYGLNLSRQAIRDKGEVILVEGYLDLIKPFQNGFENIVASLGTAVTPNQAKLIHHFTNRVVLLFDSDAAGKAAALRNMEALNIGTILMNDLDVEIVLLPEGLDPDSLIDKQGRAAMEDLLEKRKNPILFWLEMTGRGRNLDRLEERIAVARETLPLIRSFHSPLKLNEYLTLLAQKLQLNEDALRLEFQGTLRKKSGEKNQRGEEKMLDNRQKGMIDAEQKVLATALSQTYFRKCLKETLTEDDFTEPQHKVIFQTVIGLLDDEGENKLRGKLGDNQELMEALSRIITCLTASSGNPENLFFEARDWLLNQRREKMQKKPLFEEKIKNNEEPDLEAMRSFQDLVQARHKEERR
ncbi:MAG: DNA primase [Candidatus Omnitrophota bacterium]